MNYLLKSIVLPLLLAPVISEAQTPDSLVKSQRVRVVSRCEVTGDQPLACGERGPLRTYTGQVEALDEGAIPSNLNVVGDGQQALAVLRGEGIYATYIMSP